MKNGFFGKKLLGTDHGHTETKYIGRLLHIVGEKL